MFESTKIVKKASFTKSRSHTKFKLLFRFQQQRVTELLACFNLGGRSMHGGVCRWSTWSSDDILSLISQNHNNLGNLAPRRSHLLQDIAYLKWACDELRNGKNTEWARDGESGDLGALWHGSSDLWGREDTMFRESPESLAEAVESSAPQEKPEKQKDAHQIWIEENGLEDMLFGSDEFFLFILDCEIKKHQNLRNLGLSPEIQNSPLPLPWSFMCTISYFFAPNQCGVSARMLRITNSVSYGNFLSADKIKTFVQATHARLGKQSHFAALCLAPGLLHRIINIASAGDVQCPTCPNVVLAQEECQGPYCDLSRLAKLTQPAFEHGSTVVVVSLVSRIDLNGRRGIVQMFMPGSGRYDVKVDGEPASIALKSENLQSVKVVDEKAIFSLKAENVRQVPKQFDRDKLKLMPQEYGGAFRAALAVFHRAGRRLASPPDSPTLYLMRTRKETYNFTYQIFMIDCIGWKNYSVPWINKSTDHVPLVSKVHLRVWSCTG